MGVCNPHVDICMISLKHIPINIIILILIKLFIKVTIWHKWIKIDALFNINFLFENAL